MTLDHNIFHMFAPIASIYRVKFQWNRIVKYESENGTISREMVDQRSRNAVELFGKDELLCD